MRQLIKKVNKSALFFTSTLILCCQLHSQNFSGLENRKLEKANSLGTAIESGIGSIFAGKKPEGSIDSIIVIADTERELKIRIFYHGYEKAFLKIKASPEQKRVHDISIDTEIDLAGQSSPVECLLALREDFPTEQYLNSPILQVGIGKGENKARRIVSYALNKKWNVESDYDKVIVNIKPKPVNSAAVLTEKELSNNLPPRKAAFNGTLNNKKFPAKYPKALPYKGMAIKGYKQNVVIVPTRPGTVKPQGPANIPLYLWDDIRADIDFDDPTDICSINMNIFPDKAEGSGVFYFLPADYHLKYSPDKDLTRAYSFNILYGSEHALDDSSTAPVRMSARLTSGITPTEIQFIATLLKASIPYVKDLKMLPLRDNPVFSFKDYLTSQYDIAENKIAVATGSDLTSDLKVSWSTDAATKDFIQSSLTSREGIGATVILKPMSEDIIDQHIPVSINMADTRTFGKMVLSPSTWRFEKWKNPTLYPLRLKHLNIMEIDSATRTPVIRSWSLENTLVPPYARVSFDASLVPVWWDKRKSSFMWLDYSIENCEECDNKVARAITGGVSSSNLQMVRFTIIPAVFDTLKASYFLISLRSKQFDPGGKMVKQLPTALKITKEPVDFTTGPLYIPSGRTAEFEYKITMGTSDGDFIEAKQWIPCSEQDVYISKSKLKELFPSITN